MFLFSLNLNSTKFQKLVDGTDITNERQKVITSNSILISQTELLVFLNVMWICKHASEKKTYVVKAKLALKSYLQPYM